MKPQKLYAPASHSPPEFKEAAGMNGQHLCKTKGKPFQKGFVFNLCKFKKHGIGWALFIFYNGTNYKLAPAGGG
jgi:hypothetical protein